jgi:N-methylhydantoinase B
MSRATVDPITQQLVDNALSALADEMALIIFRTAHSTTVRDSMDFSTSLCNATGEQIAQAVTVPFHLGAVPEAMRTLLEQYGGHLHPGDVYIMNDPFGGGMHTPDIFIFRPVFVGVELIGFACTTAHHADLGGRMPGSAATDNTEIYQEGLRIPWLRLYHRGEIVADVVKIIRTNVRLPDMTMGDIFAQVAACAAGAAGLCDLAQRYGINELSEITTSLLDYTELLVRRELESWPDGTATFTDYLDSDGIDTVDVPITVRVTIAGDRLVADFSDAGPMTRGALNCTHSVTAATVYLAVRMALETEVPNTAGAFRPIEVITMPGTVTEVAMPGASSMRGVTGFRIVDAVNGALAQLLPDRIPAAGEGGNTLAIFGGEDRGGRFIYYELVCGTWGGSPAGDGNDGLSNPASTAANIPVEVAEAEFPVLIEKYALVPDTGGAGRWRGGMAIERSWRLLAPRASLSVRSDRQVHRPYGLSGGHEGAPSMNRLRRRSGDVELLPPMFSIELLEGDVFEHRTAGGGGWGDPLIRDELAIAADVDSLKVTPTAARSDYGICFDADGLIDQAQTAVTRAALHRERHDVRSVAADGAADPVVVAGVVG